MGRFNKAEIVDQLETGLKGAKFRILNEILYRKKEKELNPELFKKYHEGFKHQVEKWPFNPLATVIRQLTKADAKLVIADLGCGEGEIARKFRTRKVYSFDLIKPEGKNSIIEADIRALPLEDNSVDIAVLCLALMGEDAAPYIAEAWRILKPNGVLKIAEIRSRLSKIDHFVKPVISHGFTLLKKDLESNFFCFFDFKKAGKRSQTLPPIPMKPCVYKKR
ncbi:ribosomal RNA-processing protein 8 [Nematocida homosporus]|uniref:ribosomal RNA-processing protein 8 n=1 Tax=Nematocida homosporus TaxID=1912981 RepID=UPI00221F6064|nr:ribosomal RNA-processing protein 8 [Nematocida homosporus]KAI5184755.1 ribosomal RNA-processing protein 8 [Nematocida homosporus]